MKKIGEFKVSPSVSVRVYRQPGQFGMLGGKYITRVYHGAVYHAEETSYSATEAGALRVAKETAQRLRGRRTNPSKRVNYDKVLPKAQIDFAVGKYHVGTSDEEIAEDIRKRAEKMKWPEGAITAGVKYALKRHHANQGVYTAVMSGSIRNPRPRRKVSRRKLPTLRRGKIVTIKPPRGNTDRVRVTGKHIASSGLQWYTGERVGDRAERLFQPEDIVR